MYRFIGLGTMEDKIYNRQVSKLLTAKRIMDQADAIRHFKELDTSELYDITDLNLETIPEKEEVTRDSVLKRVVEHEMIYKYHEHDSYFEAGKEEALTPEEIKSGWNDYYAEKESQKGSFQKIPMKPNIHTNWN